jgi:hypothetical protein
MALARRESMSASASKRSVKDEFDATFDLFFERAFYFFNATIAFRKPWIEELFLQQGLTRSAGRTSFPIKEKLKVVKKLAFKRAKAIKNLENGGERVLITIDKGAPWASTCRDLFDRHTPPEIV